LLFLKHRNPDKKELNMSFKLFLAQTFGLIKSTSKIEAAHDALLADYKMYCEFEKSAELKEYNELDLLLKSPTFLQQKQEIQHLSLRGSKEEAQLSEYNKLGRNRSLQKFYQTNGSDELKRFQKIFASEEFTTYKKLREKVHSTSFDSKKKKDEKSEEFALNAQFHKLKESDNISFCEHFAKSKEYHNYEQFKESAERKRYDELKKIVETAEFKNRIAYLEDKHKWEKTGEHAKELRFAELKKLPQLINYQKYNKLDAFSFFKKWDLVFEDNFKAGSLDHKKWSTQSHWAQQALGRNFSQMGDLHAFTEGKNVSIEFNTLKIQVRKETTRGMLWQIPFGFVEQSFDYSSGIVSTAGIEWWKHGILEVKVKYTPSSNFVDAIYLLGEEASPQINLVEIGAKNRVGLLSKSSAGINAQCEDINGLKSGEYYIFSLEWSSHNLTWKVNGRELYTINQDVPNTKMHLNIASIVVGDAADHLPHSFEVDWVRFYQHKPKA
jgi:Beta-glucanase/Beta-glucan synthetase